MDRRPDDVVARWFDAFEHRRALTALRLADPGLVIRLPDTGSRAGARDHRGPAACAFLVARIMWLTRGTLRMEPRWIREVGRDLVQAATHNTARRGSRRLDLEMTLTYRLRKGRIVEIEEQVRDLEAWHRFWD